MPEKIEHINVGQKYKIIYERAPGVKTGDGFKVEANGDDIDLVRGDALLLYTEAKETTMPSDKVVFQSG